MALFLFIFSCFLSTLHKLQSDNFWFVHYVCNQTNNSTLCVCVFIYPTYAWLSWRPRVHKSRNCSYSHLSATMWVFGAELRTFGRVRNAFNHITNSSAHFSFWHIGFCFSQIIIHFNNLSISMFCSGILWTDVWMSLYNMLYYIFPFRDWRNTGIGIAAMPTQSILCILRKLGIISFIF